MANLELLPEDCMANILALASPRDACQLAAVSSALRWLADSAAVWERFLPSDYREIVERLEPPPMACLSKKELFLWLCTPRLMDGGKKVFSIERLTGKKRYMLSARELSITYSSNPLYWAWRPSDDSRFQEVAELRTIWWLEILSKIDSSLLSPNTPYGAYLIVKFANRAYGLDVAPFETTLEVGKKFKSEGIVKLRWNKSGIEHWIQTVFMLDRIQIVVPMEVEIERGIREREDGWSEIELGRFSNGRGDSGDEVKMGLREVKGAHLKGGLIVEGIEVRPIDDNVSSPDRVRVKIEFEQI